MRRTKVDGTHALLVYADSANLLGKIYIPESKTEAVLDADKKVDLQVNDEETKYTFMCCEQNAEQNHNIKRGNTSF